MTKLSKKGITPFFLALVFSLISPLGLSAVQVSENKLMSKEDISKLQNEAREKTKQLELLKESLKTKKVVKKYSFNEARNALYGRVKDKKTFFTRCKIWPGFYPRPNLNSCNLEYHFNQKEKQLAQKISPTHVIPPEKFLITEAGFRDCYKASSSKRTKNAIKSCLKRDSEFFKAHNDLVNIVPALSIIDKKRENLSYGMVIKIREIFQDTGLLRGKTFFQPPQEVAGDIARIAFYLNWKYKVKFSTKEIKTFLDWDKYDPVSQEEIERNRIILKTQGWANPYIEPELLENN